MKHLFIINPTAGGVKKNIEGLKADIQSVMSEYQADYELYLTKAPLDAISKIKADAQTNDELRVYACGGDGTLNECVNGCVGFSNTAVTHFPCGTGNDFVKTFGEEKSRFSALQELINGEVRPMDLIKINDRYAINICSVGFDARVGGDVHKYYTLPFFGSGSGYVISLLANLVKGINSNFSIYTDNYSASGKFAMVCLCNGRYYGGGFNPLRDAMPDDGRLDTLVVQKVNIFNFALYVGKYASGRYDQIKKPGAVIRLDASDVKVESETPFVVNIDGEIIETCSAEFSLIHHAIRFIVPSNMKFFN